MELNVYQYCWKKVIERWMFMPIAELMPPSASLHMNEPEVIIQGGEWA